MSALVALLVLAQASTQAPSPPITVSWEVVEITDTHAALVAHVKRVAAVPYPLSVRLDLPPGASLIAGRASFDVPRNEAADEIIEAFEVTYAHRPLNDLMLRPRSVAQELRPLPKDRICCGFRGE